MSLYNEIFGMNPNSVSITMLCKTYSDMFDPYYSPKMTIALRAGVGLGSIVKLERLRDSWYDKNSKHLLILTRTGGKNRKDHEDFIKKMQNHDNYIRDFDDSYDNTYMYFEFNLPDNLPENVLSELDSLYIPIETVKEKFERLNQDLTNNVETEETKKAMKVGEKIFSEINSDPSKKVKIIEV